MESKIKSICIVDGNFVLLEADAVVPEGYHVSGCTTDMEFEHFLQEIRKLSYNTILWICGLGVLHVKHADIEFNAKPVRMNKDVFNVRVYSERHYHDGNWDIEICSRAFSDGEYRLDFGVYSNVYTELEGIPPRYGYLNGCPIDASVAIRLSEVTGMEDYMEILVEPPNLLPDGWAIVPEYDILPKRSMVLRRDGWSAPTRERAELAPNAYCYAYFSGDE